ncbi:MAG: sigma 54-interacting transcriptional regulator [Deltaproteobacteria bacterium]|nr:sigma 54-interacting transcriptional regulator [Deltaproteobacteria bacterium]
MFQPTILIIDDDPDNLGIMTGFLEDQQFTILVAEEGEIGVARAGYARPDLILLDIMMPGMDGYETCRRMKAQESTREIPVIFMTALAKTEQKLRGFEVGAVDYITKPFQREEVLARVGVHLCIRQLAASLRERNDAIEAVFRSIQDAIITFDGDDNIVECNDAARKLLCIGADGSGTPSRLEDLPSSGRIDKVVNECRRQRTTIKLERHHYSNRMVSMAASPLLDRNGNHNGTVLVIHDETRLEELERALKKRTHYHGIIGASEGMQSIYALLDAVSQVNTSVLIFGESGTGKELVAKAVHEMGRRSNRPFLKLDCTALADSLLESELFGHVRGAFTGATGDKVGILQKADGGTIFLDEIGDISPLMQTRLLRFLQEREIKRVGDSTPIKVDVRVIAATNKDLDEKVKAGTFRDDLLYRLKVYCIELPPLRRRKSDIPLLISHFLEEIGATLNKGEFQVSEEARQILANYYWPGNVRELRNALESAMVRCQGGIVRPEHLPKHLCPSPSLPLDKAQFIVSALDATGGNKSKAARLLGLDRSTLYRMMRQYKIKNV